MIKLGFSYYQTPLLHWVFSYIETFIHKTVTSKSGTLSSPHGNIFMFILLITEYKLSHCGYIYFIAYSKQLNSKAIDCFQHQKLKYHKSQTHLT